MNMARKKLPNLIKNTKTYKNAQKNKKKCRR